MRDVFNPFNKKFEEVVESDLTILTSVSEGWNIEYKRQRPNARDIAKSISSFANSYGGIYFIGIAENSTNNCAGTIVGVNDSPDIIRNAVRDNLQPFPYFKTYPITLSNRSHVLMVVIPEGENPPYIHASGKIYRRQDSASDPIIAETNRYAIDELYKRAKKYERKIENFRKFDIDFCTGEENSPYLEFYINTKPFRHFLINNIFRNEDLREILNQFNGSYSVQETISGNTTSFSGDMRFDSISTYHQSVSMRYLAGHDLAYNGLTVIIDIHGNMKVLLPLITNTSSENLAPRYINVLNRSHEGSISYISFLQTRQILGDIMGLTHKYVAYLNNKNFDGYLEFKIGVINCYRKALYIDSEHFISHVENLGIPICMKSDQYFPDYPITLKLKELSENPITKPLILFALVANALGVPSEIAVAAAIDEIQNNTQQEHGNE